MTFSTRENIDLSFMSGNEDECKQSVRIMQRTEASKRVNNQQSTRVSIDHSSNDEAVDSAPVERSVIDGFDDSDLEDTERSNKEDEYVSVKNNEKENIPVNMNVSPSPMLSTIDSNKSPRLDTRMLKTMET
jgi:hypothetical protein